MAVSELPPLGILGSGHIWTEQDVKTLQDIQESLEKITKHYKTSLSAVEKARNAAPMINTATKTRKNILNALNNLDAKDKQNLDKLNTMKSLQISKMNEMVCGTVWDFPCDRAPCGGALCRDKFGNRKCGGPNCNGAMQVAKDALNKANETDTKLKRVAIQLLEAEKQIANIRQIAEDTKLKASRLNKTLSKAMSRIEADKNRSKELIKNVKNFLLGATPGQTKDTQELTPKGLAHRKRTADAGMHKQVQAGMAVVVPPADAGQCRPLLLEPRRNAEGIGGMDSVPVHQCREMSGGKTPEEVDGTVGAEEIEKIANAILDIKLPAAPYDLINMLNKIKKYCDDYKNNKIDLQNQLEEVKKLTQRAKDAKYWSFRLETRESKIFSTTYSNSPSTNTGAGGSTEGTIGATYLCNNDLWNTLWMAKEAGRSKRNDTGLRTSEILYGPMKRGLNLGEETFIGT
ncbi:unnamed protein product [Ranitomeya imitator]|uniref:LAMB1/2/3/4 helical domain-containing protein n=1 Tax=Ranitomeya imitator TaxID=111125 RepID=A0ABN9LMW3_9NEOB|nr:unnamed protein product [Ranitomeya imitator]